MGISRDSLHKRRATGGKRPQTRKKRKFESGRPASMTKLAAQRVHLVRTRGGNTKYRALRLDQEWNSKFIEVCTVFAFLIPLYNTQYERAVYFFHYNDEIYYYIKF